MATDYFLKLDGYASASTSIAGESMDAAHKGEIEIESFSWGVQQVLNIGSQSTGAGAGKAHMIELSLRALVSSASPSLVASCARGDVFNATLTIRKAGGKQEEYMKILMGVAAIGQYKSVGGGGTDPIPRDEFTIQFGTLQFEYKPQTKEGGLGAATKKGWDFIKNKTL